MQVNIQMNFNNNENTLAPLSTVVEAKPVQIRRRKTARAAK